MLHDLGVEPVEAVRAVPVGVIMETDAVQPAASRVVGGWSPVERRNGRRVQVRGIDADAGRCLRRECVLDRGEDPGRILQRVVFVPRPQP